MLIETGFDLEKILNPPFGNRDHFYVDENKLMLRALGDEEKDRLFEWYLPIGNGFYYSSLNFKSLVEDIYNINRFGVEEYAYGVCDNWEQLSRYLKTEKGMSYYSISESTNKKVDYINDPEKQYVVLLTEIRKEEQESWGGWRWHKWGEYIGTQNPQHEYLYDEKDIEKVYVYSVLRIK